VKYNIKGLSALGDVVRLTVEAGDAAEARRAGAAQGVSILTLKPQNPLALALSLRTPRPRVRFALDLFSQELLSLLESGLSLVEAIETLAEKEESSGSARALETLTGHLHRGQSFSGALEQLPELFPPLFVATVRAAEKTGDIREAVARYLEYHAQAGRIKRELVSAAIYPVLLMIVGMLVAGFMLFHVVPKFSRIYEELGSDLPFLSRMLVEWGRLLDAHTGPVLIGLACFIGGVAYGLTRPAFRRWIAPKLWTLPAIGARLRLYELSRFYRTLGMLLKSGIPLPEALDMSSGLLSPYLRAGLARAAREIREGRPVSRSLEKQGLTTRIALRLLLVGERSGRMPYMVERIALFCEAELTRWVNWFTRLFEPILMVFIGGIIGLILLMLYMPIFELAGNIK
jgi:general secretion pathway protein F